MAQPRHFPTAWRGPLPGHEFVTCSDCSGSGEGRYEGQRCGTCGGSGEVEVELPEQAQPAPVPDGDVVVPKNEDGQIVAVTRQDAEGRILSVIAESAAPAVRGPLTAERDALKADQQRKIGALARYRIETQLVDQLLEEGPNTETTAMDMEYWNDQHDQLKGVLQERDELRERVRVLEDALQVAFKWGGGLTVAEGEQIRAALGDKP